MAKEICISSTPHETRLAILEDDQLAEIYYERENEYTLAGSIYNGRVTRVLPGMQSAFVDLGLERDAFLYVTDFIELEDQEETDELEKAAAGGQPPQEIPHGPAAERDSAQPMERRPRPAQRGDHRQQGLGQESQPAPYRQAEEAATGTALPAAAPGTSIPGSQAEEDRQQEEAGGRRWRGRRRRRGGRGQAGSEPAPLETGPAAESFDETASETGTVPESYRLEPPATAHAAPARQVPPAFVLPGESLSKYGGAPDSARSAPEPTAPARPASTSKPSTLINAPLSWDGSGLLPGESISRHRQRQAEPLSEPVPGSHEDADAEPAIVEPEEEAFEEMEESVPPARHEIEAAAPRQHTHEFEE